MLVAREGDPSKCSHALLAHLSITQEVGGVPKLPGRLGVRIQAPVVAPAGRSEPRGDSMSKSALLFHDRDGFDLSAGNSTFPTMGGSVCRGPQDAMCYQ